MFITDTYQDFVPSFLAGDVSLTGDVVYALAVPYEGTDALSGRIRRNNGQLEFAVKFEVQADTQFEGAVIFELPGLMLPPEGIWFVVPALAYDASLDDWHVGVARAIRQPSQPNPPPVSVTVHFASATAAMNTTVPFAWATGDVLVFGNAVEAYNL